MHTCDPQGTIIQRLNRAIVTLSARERWVVHPQILEIVELSLRDRLLRPNDCPLDILCAGWYSFRARVAPELRMILLLYESIKRQVS